MNGKKSKELRRIAKDIAGSSIVAMFPEDYSYASKKHRTIIVNPSHPRAVYQKLKQVRRKLDDRGFKLFLESQNA